ncbi:YifB family Mg chelatase-like AAA ATPase [Catellatospora sp. KI3]|uniref:YifB family Mg chelatase-like AAA ATPase n=1 Tax=Catellatospora sp. KI3 TaxID=3041620 RepID=UPI002482EAB7|nr:YifB family Mg chelatase-like AAA ATPase [Catellatospora sp. KI3]MDI1459466.1 YifB family Mg chelatase-like AAA ATPase [Catellatospora sp. KI3]
MSYARVLCAGLDGVTGELVEVEAMLADGLPGVTVTGLPDSALNEARERVRAAITNSGETWPMRRIIINLYPADLRKRGSGFDLSMALAVLGGTGTLPLAALDGVLVLGELGLDGEVRPVRGVLPMVAAAARAGAVEAVVPTANAAEAALVPGVRVYAADSLAAVTAHIRGITALPDPPPVAGPPAAAELDLADVAGQDMGRLAVEVAAAGGHHLALFGAPGAGKTMLAQRLPSLLPRLDDGAALEVTALHSIAGVLAPGAPLVRRPPYQAPHHTASVAALVGGGSGVPRPGALSLAHRGVLFLDEAPEFTRHALDSLRQPLEDGIITLGRSRGVVAYPARVQLVLAANPCPCARPAGDVACGCTAHTKRRYRGRVSGPLLDRIDIQLELPPLKAAHLFTESAPREPSRTVAARVADARAAAVARWAAELEVRTNAEVPGTVLRRRRWKLPEPVTWELRKRLDQGVLSARGFDRVLRVAWTLGDLAGLDRPGKEEINIALELRRGSWQ